MVALEAVVRVALVLAEVAHHAPVVVVLPVRARLGGSDADDVAPEEALDVLALRLGVEAVRHVQVGQAVEVPVVEQAAPAPAAVAYSSDVADLRELARLLLDEQRVALGHAPVHLTHGGIAGAIALARRRAQPVGRVHVRDVQVEVAVELDVGDGDAHARGHVAHAELAAGLAELAFAVAEVDLVQAEVVHDVEVEQPVAVEVVPQADEGVARRLARDPRLGASVGEALLALVAPVGVRGAVRGVMVGRRDADLAARQRVARTKQVQIAVAVGVARADRVDRLVVGSWKHGRLAGKQALAVVPEHDDRVRSPNGEVEVVVAVEVGEQRAAGRVEHVDAGLRCTVDDGSVRLVQQQPVREAADLRHVDVLESVAVHVAERHPEDAGAEQDLAPVDLARVVLAAEQELALEVLELAEDVPRDVLEGRSDGLDQARVRERDLSDERRGRGVLRLAQHGFEPRVEHRRHTATISLQPQLELAAPQPAIERRDRDDLAARDDAGPARAPECLDGRGEVARRLVPILRRVGVRDAERAVVEARLAEGRCQAAEADEVLGEGGAGALRVAREQRREQHGADALEAHRQDLVAIDVVLRVDQRSQRLAPVGQLRRVAGDLRQRPFELDREVLGLRERASARLRARARLGRSRVRRRGALRFAGLALRSAAGGEQEQRESAARGQR